VCGDECRQRRRNKLARRRRRGDADEQRVDDRVRQQKCRDARKEAGCHEPASDGKSLELLWKLQQIVDSAAELSRATFRRQAQQILRKCGPIPAAGVDKPGRRHELPSALAAAENGSRSAVEWDSVTDRDGS
jgi:hypothetical protein